MYINNNNPIPIEVVLPNREFKENAINIVVEGSYGSAVVGRSSIRGVARNDGKRLVVKLEPRSTL